MQTVNTPDAPTLIAASVPQVPQAKNDQVLVKPVDNAAKPRGEGNDQPNTTRKAVAKALAAIGPSDSELLIEKDAELGRYIYKSVDRATGEVTRIWPLAEVRSAVASQQGSGTSGAALDARY